MLCCNHLRNESEYHLSSPKLALGVIPLQVLSFFGFLHGLTNQLAFLL